MISTFIILYEWLKINYVVLFLEVKIGTEIIILVQKCFMTLCNELDASMYGAKITILAPKFHPQFFLYNCVTK
jgi:hypothetical protein